MGRLARQAAIEHLLGKMENQNRTIVRQALLALREAKFQATPGNINRILNDIVRLINMMSWNFAAYCQYSEITRVSVCSRKLLNLKSPIITTLSIICSHWPIIPTSIGNIKNMLMEGNDTDISFAIELLDQIVNEEIKQVFFPVVENITRERTVQTAAVFLSGRQRNLLKNLIQDIINRDFNQFHYMQKPALYTACYPEKEGSQPGTGGQHLSSQSADPGNSSLCAMEQIEPDEAWNRYFPGLTRCG